MESIPDTPTASLAVDVNPLEPLGRQEPPPEKKSSKKSSKKKSNKKNI